MKITTELNVGKTPSLWRYEFLFGIGQLDDMYVDYGALPEDVQLQLERFECSVMISLSSEPMVQQ